MYDNIAVDEAIAALSEYQQKTGYTQAQIAKLLDTSKTTVSQLLNGVYPTPHTFLGKIDQLVRLNAKKEVAPKEPDFKETSISKKVLSAIEYAHVQRKDTVACGDAGAGKTMAALEYVRRNPNTTILIKISPTFSTKIGVAQLLAHELKIKGSNSRKIHIELRRLLDGSDKMIIVDEAQFLSIGAIEDLRCLAEECGIGLALIGNMKIMSKMTGNREEDYAQLFSRIAMPTTVFTQNITLDDIKLLFDEYELAEDALQLLLKLSRTRYGLRGTVNAFVNTAANFDEVTVNTIATVANEMHIA